MDALQEIRDELSQIRDELSRLDSHDVHDHGGTKGPGDAAADKQRETLIARQRELEQRMRDLEEGDGFKGAKDLDAEAFGTAPNS